MVDFEFIFIWRFVMVMIGILLFGYTCYCFGKTRGEVFLTDEQAEEMQGLLYYAYNLGIEDQRDDSSRGRMEIEDFVEAYCYGETD